MPDATVEPLKQAGIRSKIKNHAKRPDVALVIMDEALYHICEDVAGDVLKLPKVHKYIDDIGLKEFLISKFGVLETEETVKEEVKETPVETPVQEVEEVVEPVVAVEEPVIEQGVNTDFGAMDIPYFTSSTTDADELERVKKELEQSKLLVSSLTKQIHNADNDSDIPILVEKIKTLESQLTEANQKLEEERNSSYMAMGKVAKAEGVIAELDSVKKDLQGQREHNAKIEFDKQNLVTKLEEAQKEIKSIEEFPKKYQKAMEDLDKAHKDYNEAYAQFESKCDEYDVMVKRYSELEEKHNSSVEDFNKTIEGLKTELSEERKNSVVHSAEQDKELKQLRETISAKDVELEQSRLKLESLAKEVSEKESNARVANEKIERLNQEVISLKFDLEESRKSLGVKTEDTEKAQHEVTQLKASLETLNGQISDLHSKLSKSDLEKSDLQKKLTETEEKLGGVISSLEESTNKVTHLHEELANKTESLAQLQRDFTGESNKATTYEKAVEEKEAEIDRISNELVQLKEEVIDLKAEKSKLEEQLDELEQLRAKNRVLDESLTNSKETIRDLQEKLRGKENELKSEMSRAELSTTNMSDLEERLQTALNNIERLQGVQKECESLKDEVGRLKDELASKSEKYLTLRTEKSENEAKAEKEHLYLSNELKDKVREIERLEQEVELLKRGEDKDGKTADLRLKIVSLTEELQELKHQRDVEGSKALVQAKEELAEVRERCANLELDLVDRDEQLKEIMDSIFTQMLNCAVLNYSVTSKVDVGQDFLSNFHVIGGGSAESNLYVYKALKNTCMKHPDKRILILDLCTDSYIDAEFKIVKVNKPFGWLQGREPLTSCVANTCFKNVKAVSSGLAYMNQLGLLLINWKEKLRELRGLADMVLINIGCLDSVVSKILFQSLTEVMKGHIVVRTTPINIRTVLLCMAGFHELKNTEIACMNFDKTSNVMYQKMASKYKSRIIAEGEGLGVD